MNVSEAEHYLFTLSQLGEAGKYIRLEQNQLDSIYESKNVLTAEINRLEKLSCTPAERELIEAAYRMADNADAQAWDTIVANDERFQAAVEAVRKERRKQ